MGGGAADMYTGSVFGGRSWKVPPLGVEGGGILKEDGDQGVIVHEADG